MIRLCVEEYCNNCKHFRPHIKTEEVSFGCNITRYDTNITCERSSICEEIYKRAKRELEEQHKDMEYGIIDGVRTVLF